MTLLRKAQFVVGACCRAPFKLDIPARKAKIRSCSSFQGAQNRKNHCPTHLVHRRFPSFMVWKEFTTVKNVADLQAMRSTECLASVENGLFRNLD